MITNQRIGIDIGGVLIALGDADTSFFGENFLKTPTVPLARSSVRMLARQNEVFFISKCGPAVEAKTRLWLHEYSVLYLAKLSDDRLHFTRSRAAKVPVAQSLQLDIFIDDRKDICQMMEAGGIRAIQFTSWLQTVRELGMIKDLIADVNEI